MTTLEVVLGYFHPWPNDAGLTLGRELGLFAAHGIDLRLRVVDPGRGDGLAHLDRGEGDLAIVPINRLLAARSRGQRVRALAAINQAGLETLFSLRSLGVARPRDLSGRRVALNPTPRGLAMVRHLVGLDGGDPESLTWVDSGARELQSADLRSGLADAYFGSYWAWDELLDPGPVEDRVTWRVKDHGAPPFHSYLLAVREAALDRDGDAVAALRVATGLGYHRAAADQVATAGHFERVAPYFPREVLKRSVDLVSGTWFHGGRWGAVRDELVAPYAAWLHDSGALPGLPGLDDLLAPGAATGVDADLAPVAGARR